MTHTPPHSIDTEEAVLGAILLDPTVLIEVNTIITDGDFYRPQCATIYRTVCEMHDKGDPIDILTVGEHLKQRKLLDSVGGLVYLDQLFDSVPASENAPRYAETIKQLSTRRDIEYSCQQALQAIKGDATEQQILDALSRSVMNITGRSAGDDTRSFAELLQYYKDEFAERFNSPTEQRISFNTGLTSLDEVIDGFYPGDLVVLAARPGVGKTAFGLNCAEAVAAAGGTVLFFSLEMKDTRLLDRMLANKLSIDSRNLRRVNVTREEYDKIMDVDFGDLNFEIDHYTRNINKIRAKCMYWQHKHGKIDMVMVDYVQIVQGPGNTELEVVSHTSRSLFFLARDLNCTVLALAQLKRDSAPRPTIKDIKNSGQIEQDSDVILLMYPNGTTSGGNHIIGLDIAKNRSGSPGELQLEYEGRFNRFGTREKVDLTLQD